MKREQLAINSISTRQTGLEEAVAAYAGAGFRNVELDIGLIADWIARGRGVDDVRQLLAAHHLRCIGGLVDVLACFAPPEERQANHDRLLKALTLLHELGGGVLTIGTDGPAEATPTALDTIVATLNEFVWRIDGLNVSLALEFNWSPVIRSLQSAALVAQRVHHPQVGVLFDPAHYYTTPTKFEHLTADTVRWIKHVHFDDMADKPADLSDCNADRVLPGAGILDLRALITRLEQCDYRGYYAIEMFDEGLWQMPPAEAARRCYQSMLPFCS
jgi:2-keto-myo-inositol isomerase